MKLEPIYLVEPRPKAPSMTRRRALVMIAAAASGSAVAGFVLGRRGVRDPDSSTSNDGDPRVAALQRLLETGTDEDVLREQATIVSSCAGRAGSRTVRSAIARLAAIAASHTPTPMTRLAARALLQLQRAPEWSDVLGAHRDALERIAR